MNPWSVLLRVTLTGMQNLSRYKSGVVVSLEHKLISVQESDQNLPKVVRVTAGTGWVVASPDPHIAHIWLARLGADWLVSIDESSLMAALSSQSPSTGEIVNWGALATRLELGHALLVPSITAGSIALPAGISVPLEDTTMDCLLSKARIDLEPKPISRSNFIEHLVEEYRSAVGDRDIFAFASAGWDSRMEISLLRKALKRGRKLHLLHVFTSTSESEVVEKIASSIGASLTIFSPQSLFDSGMQWLNLRNRLQRNATWRPAVPILASLGLQGKMSIPDSAIFGFVSFDLKGRNYDKTIPGLAPRSGKIRARVPQQSPLASAPQLQAEFDRQDELWGNLVRTVSAWPTSAQWDYFTWAVRYGFTLGHRLQALSGFVNPAPWHKRELFEEFLGLDPSLKVGTTLIQHAVSSVAPELMEVPVIASSGDGNSRTEAVANDYQLDPIKPAENISYASHGSPNWFSPVESPSNPYVGSFSVLAQQARNLTTSDLAYQVITDGMRLSDAAIMNGLQLGEFLELALQPSSQESIAAAKNLGHL